MKKNLLKVILVSSCFGLFFTSCKKDDVAAPVTPVTNQSFSEEFESKASAASKGFIFKNVSDPIGTGDWETGGDTLLAPAPWWPGFSNNYVAASVFATSDPADGTISNWILTPVVTIQNGDKISFYTRAYMFYDAGAGDSTDYANRLEVRLSYSDTSTNVGNGTDPGLFETPILSINPFLEYQFSFDNKPNAYPSEWKRYEATVTGLQKPMVGRVGLRYYVQHAGAQAGNATGVAIDKFEYVSVTK